MEDDIVSAHKLLTHSNEYKKINALNIVYIFVIFIICLGTAVLTEHLKNNGAVFEDNSLPSMLYYIAPGLTVIFGLLLVISPFSVMRSFYIDIIEIRRNGIKIINIKSNNQKFITYDKFTLTAAAGKENGDKGFIIDIKKVTLKKHLYFYKDFENPQELEKHFKEYARWKESREQTQTNAG